MAEHLLEENEALVAAWDALYPLVQAALRHGPLPSYKTSAFLEANTGQRLAVLALLGHAYILADPDQRVRSMLREASNDVRNAADWCRWISGKGQYEGHVPFSEIQRRRSVPGPLAGGGTAA